MFNTNLPEVQEAIHLQAQKKDLFLSLSCFSTTLKTSCQSKLYANI